MRELHVCHPLGELRQQEQNRDQHEVFHCFGEQVQRRRLRQRCGASEHIVFRDCQDQRRER